jgi:hypothetical protein
MQLREYRMAALNFPRILAANPENIRPHCPTANLALIISRWRAETDGRWPVQKSTG